ncbi:predicted protein [Postia placenta Mad-698-R]|nr:predicted protein [Postia placenta Mad-698-R]
MTTSCTARMPYVTGVPTVGPAVVAISQGDAVDRTLDSRGAPNMHVEAPRNRRVHFHATVNAEDGAAHADARHKGLPRAIDDDLWTASVAPEDVSRRGFRRQECDRGSPQRAAQYPEHHARIACLRASKSAFGSFQRRNPPLPAPPPTSGIFINGALQHCAAGPAFKPAASHHRCMSRTGGASMRAWTLPVQEQVIVARSERTLPIALVVAHPHHSGPRQAITRHVFMPSPPLGPSITLWPLAGPVCVHGGHTAIRKQPAPRGRSFTHPHFPGFSRHFYPTREGVRKPHGLRWPPLEPAGTAKPPAIALASARPSYDTDLPAAVPLSAALAPRHGIPRGWTLAKGRRAQALTGWGGRRRDAEDRRQRCVASSFHDVPYPRSSPPVPRQMEIGAAQGLLFGETTQEVAYMESSEDGEPLACTRTERKVCCTQDGRGSREKQKVLQDGVDGRALGQRWRGAVGHGAWECVTCCVPVADGGTRFGRCARDWRSGRAGAVGVSVVGCFWKRWEGSAWTLWADSVVFVRVPPLAPRLWVCGRLRAKPFSAHAQRSGTPGHSPRMLSAQNEYPSVLLLHAPRSCTLFLLPPARHMEPLLFDCTSYSDASTPRTPSPRSDMQPPFSSPHYKPSMDLNPARYIFDGNHDDNGVVPEHHTLEAAHMWSAPYPGSYNPPGSRGSLLEELYDHDMPEHNAGHDSYLDQRHQQHPAHWSHISQAIHGEPSLPMQRHPHDIAMSRRNTFPYVRQDRPDAMYTPPPFLSNDHDSVNSTRYPLRKRLIPARTHVSCDVPMKKHGKKTGALYSSPAGVGAHCITHTTLAWKRRALLLDGDDVCETDGVRACLKCTGLRRFALIGCGMLLPFASSPNDGRGRADLARARNRSPGIAIAPPAPAGPRAAGVAESLSAVSVYPSPQKPRRVRGAPCARCGLSVDPRTAVRLAGLWTLSERLRAPRGSPPPPSERRVLPGGPRVQVGRPVHTRRRAERDLAGRACVWQQPVTAHARHPRRSVSEPAMEGGVRKLRRGIFAALPYAPRAASPHVQLRYRSDRSTRAYTQQRVTPRTLLQTPGGARPRAGLPVLRQRATSRLLKFWTQGSRGQFVRSRGVGGAFQDLSILTVALDVGPTDVHGANANATPGSAASWNDPKRPLTLPRPLTNYERFSGRVPYRGGTRAIPRTVFGRHFVESAIVADEFPALLAKIMQIGVHSCHNPSYFSDVTQTQQYISNLSGRVGGQALSVELAPGKTPADTKCCAGERDTKRALSATFVRRRQVSYRVLERACPKPVMTHALRTYLLMLSSAQPAILSKLLWARIKENECGHRKRVPPSLETQQLPDWAKVREVRPKRHLYCCLASCAPWGPRTRIRGQGTPVYKDSTPIAPKGV